MIAGDVETVTDEDPWDVLYDGLKNYLEDVGPTADDLWAWLRNRVGLSQVQVKRIVLAALALQSAIREAQTMGSADA